LWISAGGSKALAPVAAAIAEAESGGNSDARNASGASGLWQILGDPAGVGGNVFDPATNAKMAVAKYHQAPGGGNNFSPWVTFTNGAYKAFLSNKTTPDSNVPGSPSAANAQAAATGSVDCLVQNPLSISVPLVGSLSAGPSCLFSMSNARAFIGAGLVVAGGVMGLAALAFAAVSLGMKAAGPLGSAAEGVGGALMLVPGAEAAGAGIAAAGAGAKHVAKGQGAKVAQKRQRRAAREDADGEKRLGNPRENPDMEVRGGAVRQTPGQRQAQRRREQGAARARQRVRPASREETGF
jgi:hypothetical protein